MDAQRYEEWRRELEADSTPELKAAQVERFQKHIDTRLLPPMAQMTRMQKRYFLEPWMTTLSVAFAILAVAGYIAGIFTPWHVEFCMLGLLFTLLGIGTLTAKLFFMDWNTQTEGQIQGRR